MLNAIWLETFTRLSEVGHFTRAAAQLGMTQPGVSQHLRKLEAQVGQPLIVQQGKSFALTPAGDAVQAVGLARRAEEAVLRAQIAVDDPDAGRVAIACSGSFALMLYPRLVDRMRTAPDLVLDLTAVPQPGIVAAVLAGEVDLGIVADRPTHPRLEAVHLGQEELCLLLPSGAVPQAVTLATLDALGFVSHPDAAGYADDLLALNFPESYAGADRLRQRTFVNQIGQIPVPVAAGIGYTILPRSGVAGFAERDRLRIHPLPQRLFRDLWLVSRRGRSQFARIAGAAALVAQAAAALDPS